MRGHPFESIPMRVVLRPLVATLQLFGVYVYLHGHYSPGGGFQAGVLLACSVILPILVHGPEAGMKCMDAPGPRTCCTSGRC